MVKELITREAMAGKKSRAVIKGRHKGAKTTIRDMLDTAALCAETSDIKGISANRIGVNQRIILCLLTLEGKTSWVSMINPVITDHSSATTVREEHMGDEEPKKVTRYNSVIVTFLQTNGQNLLLELSGENAFTVQQQIDYLDGRV